MNIDTGMVADWFKRFAEKECKGVSPLYYYLSTRIAKDNDLLRIASFCAERQPIPNLFLAAVHYLLLKNPTEHLAKYYPTLGGVFEDNIPIELFKEFCLEYEADIIELEQSRVVQTNVLNRCAYLMPILSSQFSGQKVNVIDVGASAGLNLNMDKYAYYYDGTYSFGNGEVAIQSNVEEGVMPAFSLPVSILNKVGIDQLPIDLTNNDNALWLKALIWADKVTRMKRLGQAIEIAGMENLNMRVGRTIDDFEEIIREQNPDIPLAIYHTHVLYQFSKEERMRFREMLDRVGRDRDITYVAAESSLVHDQDWGLNGILVLLTTYTGGVKKCRMLAKTKGHADWIHWMS